MNKKVKAKWLAALRSGEYKQGKRQLRDNNNNYCCLGVLCDIHAKETGDIWIRGLYLSSTTELPDTVVNYANLDNTSPYIDKLHKSLIGLNDNENKSFLEIADIIEKYL